MTISEYFEHAYHLQDCRQSAVARFPCAEDGKSCIYFSIPFEGVFCWANDVYCKKIPAGVAESFNGLSLNFCTEGGCEVELFNGNFVYVTKGILSIDTSAAKLAHDYPTSRYRGLEVIFDFSVLEKNGGGALAQFGFNPCAFEAELAPRATNGSLMAAPGAEWKKKAQNLEQLLISRNATAAQIRFYLLELLFLIAEKKEPLNCARVQFMTKGQRRIAAETERLVTENLARRFTVQELAERYGVSASSLKKYFAQVYGMPFSTYLHKMRMDAAAHLLAEGTLPVGEVAERTGYQNQGKFGAAFKAFYGTSPLEYRRLSVCGGAE